MNRLNLALMRVTAAALEQVRPSLPLPHFCKGVQTVLTPLRRRAWQDTEFFVPFFTPGQYTLQMRYYPAQDPDFVCADPRF
eukprot:COSAG04_NODE_990_length_8924_cov_2.947535_7_plen_81_part_00